LYLVKDVTLCAGDEIPMPSVISLKVVVFLTLAAFSTMVLLSMWKGNSAFIALVLLGTNPSKALSQCNSGSGTVNLKWHRPNATSINNLTAVINGTGIYGFQFQSTTPSSAPYTTYNWCNMPHVRQQEYVVPSSEYELQYVEVVRYQSHSLSSLLIHILDSSAS
jgi:hypothetical protein